MNTFESKLFGYQFVVLSKEHIEILRLWRTNADLQPFMRFREMISPEQQLIWFNNLTKTSNDLHLIVHLNSQPVAYLATKQLSISPLHHEFSFILGDKSLNGSTTALVSAIYLLIIQHGFIRVDAVYATVLSNNFRVLKMLHSLGFAKIEDKSDYYLLHNTKDKFTESCPKFVDALKKITNEHLNLEIKYDSKYDWVVANPDYEFLEKIGADLHIISF